MVSVVDVDQLCYDLENVCVQYCLVMLELFYIMVVVLIFGVIVLCLIKIGNFVQINILIFCIVDNLWLEVIFNVFECELVILCVGQLVMLVVDVLLGQSFIGIVDCIVLVVDLGSGMFCVVSVFDGVVYVLQFGMFGCICIDYDQCVDVLVVLCLVLFDDGEFVVFCVCEGKVVCVLVKLGYVEGLWVEICDGLVVGDQVVIVGKVVLCDGIMVQVIVDLKVKVVVVVVKFVDKVGSK